MSSNKSFSDIRHKAFGNNIKILTNLEMFFVSNMLESKVYD